MITNERAFVALFDGKYANRLDILAFEEDFVFDKNIEALEKYDLNQNFKNKQAILYRFRNWDPYTKSKCDVNVKYYKKSSPSFDKKQQFEDATYKI